MPSKKETNLMLNNLVSPKVTIQYDYLSQFELLQIQTTAYTPLAKD